MKLANLRKALFCLATGAGLASCMAHGYARNVGIDTRPNFIPYDKAFYENLLSGRAWIFEGVHHPNYRNMVRGFVFARDGSRIGCLAYKKKNGDPLWLAQRGVKWEVLQRVKLVGAVVRHSYGDSAKVRHLPLFYDPVSGQLAGEVVRHDRSGKDYWIRSETGHIQDTWPRALADACPGLELPPGLEINEKQTSLRMDELRRQDPGAPIRNFPGSQHRAPGTTGLGASRGAPTTTLEEVEAYLLAQEGNVLKSPGGRGFVYARHGGQEELWELGDDGLLETWSEIERSPDGKRVTARVGDRDRVYMVGYPFPFAPTGHRHQAWRLTDALIGRAEPVALPWMGERYADHRFLFHDKTLTIVAPGDRYFTGRWRWTRGRLQVTVDGEERYAQSIAWPDLARELGVTPKVWTPLTPNRR